MIRWKRILKKYFGFISHYQYLPYQFPSQVVSNHCQKIPCVANSSDRQQLNEGGWRTGVILSMPSWCSRLGRFCLPCMLPIASGRSWSVCLHRLSPRTPVVWMPPCPLRGLSPHTGLASRSRVKATWIARAGRVTSEQMIMNTLTSKNASWDLSHKIFWPWCPAAHLGL